MSATMTKPQVRRSPCERQSPCGFEAGDANLYRYVGNDPANATDPSGLVVIITQGIRDTGDTWAGEIAKGLREGWKMRHSTAQAIIQFTWSEVPAEITEAPLKATADEIRDLTRIAVPWLKDYQGTPAFLDATWTSDGKDSAPVHNFDGRPTDVAAAKNLGKFLTDLRKFLGDKYKDEPINVIAHSQGSVVMIRVLRDGTAKIDNLLTLGSPLDVDLAKKEGHEALQSVKGTIDVGWSRHDKIASELMSRSWWEGTIGEWNIAKEDIGRIITLDLSEEVASHGDYLRADLAERRYAKIVDRTSDGQDILTDLEALEKFLKSYSIEHGRIRLVP